MAMENLGIGGILSFESRGAVANMSLAQRGFTSLSRAATTAQANVGKITGGLSQFSLIGAGGLVAGAVGIKKWVSEGMAFNKEMETSRIAIATIMATVTKTPLAQNLNLASEAMAKLNRIAADAPGETQDILNIFQLMTGPILAAGGSMDELYKNTKGTAILAGVLKRGFNDTGAAMAKLTSGAYEAGNDIHLMLKSMGLLTESTKEWKAMLPQDRLKRMNQILSHFAESGELVGKSMDAMAGSARSNMKILAGAFSKSFSEQASKGLGNFNDAFYKNSEQWISQLDKLGARFGAVIGFFVEELKFFGKNVQTVFTYLEARVKGIGGPIREFVERFGHMAVQAILLVTALSPVITVLGFVGSKIGAIVSVASGLFGLLSTLVVPLLPVIAVLGAIFMLFRTEGETPRQTLGRAFEYIEFIIFRIHGAIQSMMTLLSAAFLNVQATAAALWAGIQPGIEAFRASVQGVIDLIVGLFNFIGPMLAQVVLSVTVMLEYIRPGFEAIFNGLAAIINTVIDGINLIMPKIMSVLGPIFNVLTAIAEKVAMVLGKVLSALEPVLEVIRYLFEKIFELGGWIIDTFGPTVTAIFQGIAKVVGTVLDALSPIIDALKWLLDHLKGPLKFAIDALGVAFKVVGWVIDTIIITPIKWLVGAIQKIIDGMTWISDKISTGGMGENLKAQANQAIEAQKKEAESAERVRQRALATMQAEAKFRDQVLPMMDKANKELQQLAFNMAVDNAGVQVMDWVKAIGIKPDNPDINLKVGINQSTNMCVNGRNIATAQSAYETEVTERAGFSRTPWQTQRVQITGMDPKQ